MASERRQDSQPTPTTSRIGPSMSVSVDQNAAPNTSHLGHIPTRAATSSSGLDSAHPVSSEGDDEQNRLLPDASPRASILRFSHRPEEINIEIPQQAAFAPTLTHSPQHDAPAFPRSSVHHANSQRRSELDWIIPVEPKRERPKTLHQRLLPTLETAKVEKVKYALKARLTGYALNIAIGLQVLLGSLTTGLAASSSGKINIVILGALSTIVASYLARARGSNEPELSITRCKDLEQYIRECEIFMMDYGHLTGSEHDVQLNELRHRFEELLGTANGERRLATPV